MKDTIFGDCAYFAIKAIFYEEEHQTELYMYINNINILEYSFKGSTYTTKWNLDDLTLWLGTFLQGMKEDPFPVDINATFAAEKDILARNFDSDNLKEFDEYYNKLDLWNSRHRWHTASSGAILADLYFEQKGNSVEISWNNTDCEPYVTFRTIQGGAKINKQCFEKTVWAFLEEYQRIWYD